MNEGTVARGHASSGPIISGVGSMPVGLSGVARPRPIAPMPSDMVRAAEPAVLTANTSASSAKSDGGFAASATTRRVGAAKTALVVAGCLALLFALAAVFKTLGDSNGPPSSTTKPPTTPPPPPPVGGVAPPTDVRVSAASNGQRTVSWSHGVADPTEFTYQVFGVQPGSLLAEVKGEMSAQIDAQSGCVWVRAVSPSGQFSEDKASVSTACPS